MRFQTKMVEYAGMRMREIDAPAMFVASPLKAHAVVQ